MSSLVLMIDDSELVTALKMLVMQFALFWFMDSSLYFRGKFPFTIPFKSCDTFTNNNNNH